MSIGENIAKQRKNLNMTQKQLAEKLVVSDKTISSWENERTYPDISTLIRISDILDVSIDELLREDIEMVKAIDASFRRSILWEKWKRVVISLFILIGVFIVINISWLSWVEYRQAKLDNYEWSEEELSEEQLLLIGGRYIIKDDMYISLRNYYTKSSTPYLFFDTTNPKVNVSKLEGYTLTIEDIDELTFYNGQGKSISMNWNLECTGGVNHQKKMTTAEREIFFKEYEKEIREYFDVGIELYNDFKM